MSTVSIPAEGTIDVPEPVSAIVDIVLETYPTTTEIFFGVTDDYEDGRYFQDSPTLHLADDTYVSYEEPDGRNGTSCWTAELSDEIGPRLGKFDSLLIAVGPPVRMTDPGPDAWDRFGYRP